MEIYEDKFYKKAEEAASEISKKANECCNRTDGYEEDIKKIALDEIKEIIDFVLDVAY